MEAASELIPPTLGTGGCSVHDDGASSAWADLTAHIARLPLTPPQRNTQRLEIISLSGSAGTAVAINDRAMLRTDGRHILQATQELDANWNGCETGCRVQCRSRTCGRTSCQAGSTVGFTSHLISNKTVGEMHASRLGWRDADWSAEVISCTSCV